MSDPQKIFVKLLTVVCCTVLVVCIILLSIEYYNFGL